jgi:hypothetical protein
MNDEQMLLLAMVMVHVDKGESAYQHIYDRLCEAGRACSDPDVEAEYRLEYADAIIKRWKRRTHRA